MPRLRTTVAALAATAITGLAAAPALAHDAVERTSPKQGATVKRPASASVSFNQQVRSGTLRVTGPGGKLASVGRGGVDPRNVTRLLVELRSGLRSGAYRATWTIVAADGHKQHGSFTFRVKR